MIVLPLLCAMGMAAAPGGERIAVAPAVSPDDKVPAFALEKIQELVQHELGDRLALTAGQLQVLARGEQKSQAPSVEAARARLAKAQRAYFEVDLHGALSLLEESVAQVHAHLDELRPDQLEVLLELEAWRALVLQTDGRLVEADRVLEAIAVLRPAYRLDPVSFPPQMHEALARAVVRVGARRQGELEIASTPGFATVYLDGVERGKTPLTLKGLAQGQHIVRLEAPGHRPASRRVELEAAPRRLVIGLQPDEAAREVAALLEALRQGHAREPALARARAAAVALGVDALLLLSVAPAGADPREGFEVVAGWIRPAGPPHLASGVVDADLIGGRPLAAQLLAALAQGPGPTRVGGGEAERALAFDRYLLGHAPRGHAELFTPPPEPPKPTAIYRRWWFWTAAVGVAAAAGGGAWALTRPAEPPGRDRTDLTISGLP